MDIVGRTVLHSKYGCGLIIWLGELNAPGKKYIRVQFDNKTIEFPYPLSFKKYISAIDEDFIQFIDIEIKQIEELAHLQDATIPIKEYKLSHHKTQNHTAVSYCSINTFVFKSSRGYNRGKYGFETYDTHGRKVGIVFMHDDKRRVAFGQAEICFYEEYFDEFGEWRLISINKERLMFNRLSLILEEQGTFEANIDPRKGS